jgi:integrase
VLQPAQEAADLPWVGFHAFCRTCASILFAEGRNAVQVQRWLGHHSAAFTLATYVHLLDDDLGEPLRIPQNVRNDAE